MANIGAIKNEQAAGSTNQMKPHLSVEQHAELRVGRSSYAREF